MKFKVCISETLERVVEVEADDEEKAFNMVVDGYKAGEYVLTADDFVGVAFDNLCN